MRLNAMSKPPIQTTGTSDPPPPSFGDAEPPRHSAAYEEPRCIADVVSDRDAFAAEVSRELALIRSLLSSTSIGDRPAAPSEAPWTECRSSSAGPSHRTEERPTAPARSPSEEDGNGHDRLAALKKRLAAKLQEEVEPSPEPDGSEVAVTGPATNGPATVEGLD